MALYIGNQKVAPTIMLGGGGGGNSFVINVLDNYDTEETHEESLSWDPTLYDPFYPYISLRTEENWYLYVSESGNIAVCQSPYNTAILPVLHMPGIPVDIDGWISTNGPIIDRNYSGYVIERERFCYLCYGENKEVEFLGTWQEE